MNPSPNFLIIGAAKAGTTSLYEYLIQHPDVFMSDPKEPHFFSTDHKYNKGFSYYEKFFEGYQEENRIGEGSVSYSTYTNLEKTIQRICDFNKEMKLIYILRNPFSRAYSSYWWNVRMQAEPLSFEDALQQEENRIYKDVLDQLDPWSYKRRGLYFYIIQQYLKYFPKKNLKVILLEDLNSSSIKICNDVYSFLNLKKFDATKLEEDKINKAVIPTNKFVQKLMNDPSTIRNFISYILQHTLGIANKKKLHDFISKKTLKPFDYPPMKENTFEYLEKYFKNDIKQLENFLNRELTQWLNSKEILCGLSK